MKFAHGLGTIFSLIIVLFLYFIHLKTGWILVAIFAILKTISAFGYCPASKIYSCMKKGGCCSISRKLNKNDRFS